MDKSIALTRRWLKTMVVGLNLCPFARQVIDDNSLRISVSEAVSDEDILKAVLMEMDALHRSREQEVSTALLIFSCGLEEFNQYLLLLDQAQQLLEQVGLEGIFQIASFHPDYCFAGVDEDAVENYSNRSPLPMLHFIREAQLDRVLDSYPHPEAIPENNINTLNALGAEALARLYDSLQAN